MTHYGSYSDKNALKLAVIGYPVMHSRTPRLQTEIGKLLGIKVECDRIETGIDVSGTFDRLVKEQYSGFNCTMPCKAGAALLCSTLSARASLLSAVNTVKIDGKKTYGDTTDGVGMLRAIKRHAGTECISGAVAAVLGCGGTARSVIYELAEQGAACVNIVIRSKTSSESFVSLMKRKKPNFKISTFDFDNISGAVSESTIIINATPLGMRGSDEFKSLDFIKSAPAKSIFADAVYEPMTTDFISEAASSGHITVGGIDMLIYQGIEAFNIWSGIDIGVDTADEIRDKLYNSIKTL